MSTEEQHVVIGRTISQYVIVRKELAALRAVASEKIKAIGEVAVLLRDEPEIRIKGEQRWDAALAAFPAREEIETLSGQISQAAKERDRLRVALRELGFEPKD